MSGADAAWLHMDRATNRMIVTSVMWFDEKLDWDAVRTVLRERLVQPFPRFRQRVVDRTTSVWWEDDEDFDLDKHLHQTRLPEPGGMAQLQAYVSDHAGRPLPRSRPLWEMHLIDGFRGSGSAVVSRIHHCIADGAALSRVLMSLTDNPAEASLADVRVPKVDPGSAWLPVLRTAGEAMADVLHPLHLAHDVQSAAGAAKALSRVLALKPDASTALRGFVGTQKTVLWDEPLALESLRSGAHALGATLNDLVLTAVAGALRSYLARSDGRARDIRAILPVNLRPPAEPLPADLGNRFGLVFLDLPLSIDDPLERMAAIRARTARLKRSAEAAMSFAVLEVTGHTPYAAQQVVTELFATKASAVITNVAGSTHPVFLAGRRVRGTIGWPPESGNLALGVAIISYDGELTLGLMADRALIAKPQQLLADTRAGVLELLTVAAAVPSPA